MKRYNFLVYIGAMIVVLLQLLYVYVQTTISTGGKDLKEIQDEIEEVRRENRLIYNEILTVTSLSYINEKAREQGFVSANYLVLR